MIYVCELLTEEPEGGSAMIPFAVFSSLYRFLACLHCDGKTPRDIIVKSQTDLTSNIDDLSGGTSDDLCKVYTYIDEISDGIYNKRGVRF